MATLEPTDTKNNHSQIATNPAVSETKQDENTTAVFQEYENKANMSNEEVKADVSMEDKKIADGLKTEETKADMSKKENKKAGLSKEEEKKENVSKDKEIKEVVSKKEEKKADMSKEEEIKADGSKEEEIKVYVSKEEEITANVSMEEEIRADILNEEENAVNIKAEIKEDVVQSEESIFEKNSTYLLKDKEEDIAVHQTKHERMKVITPSQTSEALNKDGLLSKTIEYDESQVSSKQQYLRKTEEQQNICKNCEPCKETGKDVPAKSHCTVCDEILCESCTSMHRALKATKSHTIVEIYNVMKRDDDQAICELCHKDKICIYCKQTLCNLCLKAHMDTVEHKEHNIVDIERQQTIPAAVCNPCSYKRKAVFASKACKVCMTHLCFECSADHRNNDITKEHKIVDIAIHKENEEFQNRPKMIKPSRPIANRDTKADSVIISWSRPVHMLTDNTYQVRYKEFPDGLWKFYTENPKSETIKVKNLKSDTEYIFQIRMVTNDEEGPYSDQSDIIRTTKSSADRILEFTCTVQSIGDGLTLRKIPVTEIHEARNTYGKTRKFEFGTRLKTRQNAKERTIMLVGETGSGKSTLVDGIVNYVLGVNWNDAYRYTLVDLEDEEKDRLKNQAISQTQWITSYTITNDCGNRLDYELNIIDTPGFGDTRGIERDQEIIEQIRELFTAKGTKGVAFIDAICFLIKAPDARLTPTQRYIFNAIMSMFGHDIEDNICILITFADGKSPPVLAALAEAELPNKVYFPFNNSGLFAENSGPSMSCLSPMFWEMGTNSFKSFFDHLATMETKSLNQTKQVLTERRTLELTIENLQPAVDIGLNKLEELKLEIRLLELHKSDIEDNKDFHYVVIETKQVKHDLPKGQHVTNCLNCHVTCHQNCGIPRDEDKRGCWAMDGNGNCTQCSSRCCWSQHANTPYIFEYIQEESHKTYAEKEEKYRKAQGETMTHGKVIARMTDELFSLEDNIIDMMDTVNKCNNILREIALRPNPLSMTDHIDLLIEGEKLEKRTGFKQRIEVLNQFRKKTLSSIGQDIVRFQKAVGDYRQKTPGSKSKKKKSLFGHLKFW